jgi:hypothetical protein
VYLDLRRSELREDVDRCVVDTLDAEEQQRSRQCNDDEAESEAEAY